MSATIDTLTALSQGETPVLADTVTSVLVGQDVTLVWYVNKGAVYVYGRHGQAHDRRLIIDGPTPWYGAETWETWGKFVNDYIQEHPVTIEPDPNWRTNRRGPYRQGDFDEP